MQHRDRVTILKIIDEIDIGMKLLGTSSQEEFLENELLKRALGMTCINVGELVKVISEDVYVTIRDEYPQLKRKLSVILERAQKNEIN